MCQAKVQDNFHSYCCTKRATKDRKGLKLCGTHARQFDRWETETWRQFDEIGLRMAETYWNATPNTASTE